MSPKTPTTCQAHLGLSQNIYNTGSIISGTYEYEETTAAPYCLPAAAPLRAGLTLRQRPLKPSHVTPAAPTGGSPHSRSPRGATADDSTKSLSSSPSGLRTHSPISGARRQGIGPVGAPRNIPAVATPFITSPDHRASPRAGSGNIHHRSAAEDPGPVNTRAVPRPIRQPKSDFRLL